MSDFMGNLTGDLQGQLEGTFTGNSLWDDLKKGGDEAADKIMGPSADYYEQLQTPAQKGVGDNGDIGQLFTNGKAVFEYVQQLTTGPKLGNSQFVQTAGMCKVDKGGGQWVSVPRWTLVNNRVSGSDILPANLKNAIGGGAFDGLIPGMFGDIASMNPTTLLSGLTSPGTPQCRAYMCPVTTRGGVELPNEIRFIAPGLELLDPAKSGCGWVGDDNERALAIQEEEKQKAYLDSKKTETDGTTESGPGAPPFTGQGSSAQGAISGQIERATGVSEAALAEEQRRRAEQQKTCESCQEGFWVPAPFSVGPARMVAKPDYSQHLLLGLAVIALISFALIK